MCIVKNACEHGLYKSICTACQIKTILLISKRLNLPRFPKDINKMLFDTIGPDLQKFHKFTVYWSNSYGLASLNPNDSEISDKSYEIYIKCTESQFRGFMYNFIERYTEHLCSTDLEVTDISSRAEGAEGAEIHETWKWLGQNRTQCEYHTSFSISGLADHIFCENYENLYKPSPFVFLSTCNDSTIYGNNFPCQTEQEAIEMYQGAEFGNRTNLFSLFPTVVAIKYPFSSHSLVVDKDIIVNEDMIRDLNLYDDQLGYKMKQMSYIKNIAELDFPFRIFRIK